jgi:hypothetical protein
MMLKVLFFLNDNTIASCTFQIASMSFSKDDIKILKELPYMRLEAASS